MKLDEILDYTADQKRALIAISAIALSVAGFFLFASKGEALETPTVKVISEAPRRSIFVHVAGDVRRPGVYPILEGSRVIDAISAAGGAKNGVDLSNINLARILADGEQVYVGIDKSPRGNSGSKKSYTGIIYINRATSAQFDSLSGIGPVLAKRIVEYRRTNGPFLDVADLQKVEGIGAKTFEKIKSRLSL
jgi:competence protein ComEA